MAKGARLRNWTPDQLDGKTPAPEPAGCVSLGLEPSLARAASTLVATWPPQARPSGPRLGRADATSAASWASYTAA